MDNEKLLVNLLINNTDIVSTELELLEELPSELDFMGINLNIDGQINCFKGENFFDALLTLRKELEKRNMLILCNGAAENVYPLTMQLAMGDGRLAYKLYLGQQARMLDLVDIFEYDKSLDFVSVETQLKFFDKWIKNIMKS